MLICKKTDSKLVQESHTLHMPLNSSTMCRCVTILVGSGQRRRGSELMQEL